MVEQESQAMTVSLPETCPYQSTLQVQEPHNDNRVVAYVLDGVEVQARVELSARRRGLVLREREQHTTVGVGEMTTFETVAQVHLDAPHVEGQVSGWFGGHPSLDVGELIVGAAGEIAEYQRGMEVGEPDREQF